MTGSSATSANSTQGDTTSEQEMNTESPEWTDEILEARSFSVASLSPHPSPHASISSHVVAADMVTTFAGSTRGWNNGKGMEAQFRRPWGICLNPRDKCMYVCEYATSRIRRISMEGISAHK